MNTKQLQYFLTTCEMRSISAASRELDVSQPAISLQLSNLEHELKVTLFERDFKGVKLTALGRQFEEHARVILDKMNNAKLDLTGSQKECKGKVVLGLSRACANVLSIDLLKELEHRFANIELTFKIGPSYRVEQWLNDGKVDIILSFESTINNAAILSVPIIRENLYLYISHHPKNPAYSALALYGTIEFNDLQFYDVFLPDPKDSMSILLNDTAKKCGIKLKKKNAFDQLMITLHYVTQGFGLVILPSSGAFHLESNNQIRAVNIENPKLQRAVYLKVFENKCQNKAVNAVFELVREITATKHYQQVWRGDLLDNKYAYTDAEQLIGLTAK